MLQFMGSKDWDRTVPSNQAITTGLGPTFIEKVKSIAIKKFFFTRRKSQAAGLGEGRGFAQVWGPGQSGRPIAPLLGHSWHPGEMGT